VDRILARPGAVLKVISAATDSFHRATDVFSVPSFRWVIVYKPSAGLDFCLLAGIGTDVSSLDRQMGYVCPNNITEG